LVDEVLLEILEFFPHARSLDEVLSPFDATVKS